ncbi:MAG: rhodanese-like domain-containing protein [Proteobacteria bacterium]|nr:rhodanese-like domain-containing protein [Pseudomonadota bacterium]
MSHFSTLKTVLLFIVILVAISSRVVSCSGAQSIPVPKEAFVVDVRTPREFQKEHFPEATNIPVDQIEARLDEFGDKNQPIVVYCRSGRRSGIAKKTLERAGYQNVINGGGLRQMLKSNP